MDCCMCWWTKGHVDVDNDARETLLNPDQIEDPETAMNKKESKKKAAKEQEYRNVLDKYRKKASPDQGAENANVTVKVTPTSNVVRSNSSASGKHKADPKNKLILQSQSCVEPYSKAKQSTVITNVNNLTDSGLSKVQQGLSERGDKLKKTEEKTEELVNNARHHRSLSRKLKEKQAEKLKKSKLPW